MQSEKKAAHELISMSKRLHCNAECVSGMNPSEYTKAKPIVD